MLEEQGFELVVLSLGSKSRIRKKKTDQEEMKCQHKAPKEAMKIVQGKIRKECNSNW